MRVPQALLGKLPRMILELADPRIAFSFSVVVFGIIIYGLSRAHNAWMYVVPSVAGPLLAAVLFMVRPFNPYRTIYARIELMWDAGTTTRGPESRLVELLRSTCARRVSLRVGVLNALVLLAICGSVALLRPGPLQWSCDFGIVLMTALFACLSFLMQVNFLLRWAFAVWAES